MDLMISQAIEAHCAARRGNAVRLALAAGVWPTAVVKWRRGSLPAIRHLPTIAGELNRDESAVLRWWLTQARYGAAG